MKAENERKHALQDIVKKDKSVKAIEKTPQIGAPYSNHASVLEQEITTGGGSQDQSSARDADHPAAAERGDTETPQRTAGAAARQQLYMIM